jgi:phosphopantothenoylcysteine decarboxylase
MPTNVLLSCSGSVAVIKVPELVVGLIKAGFKVQVILTKNAEFFWERAKTYNLAAWAEFEALLLDDIVLRDEDEWSVWNKKGDPVLHIEARRWADILVSDIILFSNENKL